MTYTTRSIDDRSLLFILAKALILCLPSLLLVYLGMTFARTQCVWVDETTQLSGLTLSPWRQVHWLAGTDPHTFGVPYDRNPPLSYWVQSLWAAVFGNDEYTLRMCSLAAMTVAQIALMFGSLRIGGIFGSLTSGLLFALSPTITTLSVEIRPYPFLIALSALGMNALVSLVRKKSPSHWRWAGLTLLCVLASYCHFYGIVMSAAFFASAAAMQMFLQRTFRPIFVAFGSYLLMALGVLPFILAAFSKSSPKDDVVAQTGVRLLLDGARNIYRLVGHPAATVYTLVCFSLLAGVCGLLILAMSRVVRKEKDEAASECGVLCLAIFLGLAAPICAAVLTSKFDAFNPLYSAWIQPLVFMLLAAAFQGLPRYRLTWSAAVLVAFGALSSSWIFINYQELFVHGAHRHINELIRKYKSPDLIVVHDRGWSGFPLFYEHGKSLLQTYPGETNSKQGEFDFTFFSGDSQKNVTIDQLPSETTVIAISWEQRGALQIRRHLLLGDKELDLGPVSRQLSASNNWRLIESQNAYGFEAAHVMVFQKTQATSDHTPLPAMR